LLSEWSWVIDPLHGKRQGAGRTLTVAEINNAAMRESPWGGLALWETKEITFVTAYSQFVTPLLMLGISMCPALPAATAYTTFSGGNFDTGVSINTQGEDAQAFSPTISGSLLSITVAVGTSPNADPANNIEDVFLYADASGGAGRDSGISDGECGRIS
jgi:hypothetical protein